MCNLYSMTTTHEAMRRLFKAATAGTNSTCPGIYPDKQAPIVRRIASGEREIIGARWGMPTPPAFLKPGVIDRGVINIRNTNSPHWRAWMKLEFRCLVPVTSFCEPTDTADPVTGKKVWMWVAIDNSRPLVAFAGIWCVAWPARDPEGTRTGRALALWLPHGRAQRRHRVGARQSDARDLAHGRGV
jgi:putative SOS response-associated peptidase YedK